MLDTAKEVRSNTYATFAYGLLQTDTPDLYSDIAYSQEGQWKVNMNGEREREGGRLREREGLDDDVDDDDDDFHSASQNFKYPENFQIFSDL